MVEAVVYRPAEVAFQTNLRIRQMRRGKVRLPLQVYLNRPKTLAEKRYNSYPEHQQNEFRPDCPGFSATAS